MVALNREEEAALHQGMRDKPCQASRTSDVLSKWMNLAETWSLQPDRSSSCDHVAEYREGKGERYAGSLAD